MPLQESMTGTDPLASYTRLREVSRLNTLSKPMYGPATEALKDVLSSEVAATFRPTNSSKANEPVKHKKPNGSANKPSGNNTDDSTTSSTPKKKPRKLKPMNP